MSLLRPSLVIFYFIFHLLMVSFSFLLLFFSLSLHSLSLLFLPFSLFFNHLWLNLFLSLSILLYSLVHIILCLNCFRVVMIPVLIISLKQTQGQINIIYYMFYFCYYLLIYCIFLPASLLLLLSNFFFNISDLKLFPFDFTHDSNDTGVKHFVYVIKLILIMVG